MKQHKNCRPIGPFNKGYMEDMGFQKRPLFRLEQTKMSGTLERPEDICIVVSLLNNNRLVTIWGMPGIGKTTVAKFVAQFLEEREKFPDGIIYISMNKKTQTNMFISQLYYIIKKFALKELGMVLKNAKLQKEQKA